MIDIVNREASQLVLGHELSSQSSPGSGQLGITAAIAVRQDCIEGDCNWLGNIVRRDIFRPMVDRNLERMRSRRGSCLSSRMDTDREGPHGGSDGPESIRERFP